MNARHDHDPATGNKRLGISIGLNLAITLAEVVGGLLSGSLALLSDAMHNLNDTASLGVSYLARRLGKRPPDPERSYGYRRAEILGAFVNLIVLVVIGLVLIKEAITRYLTPRDVNAPIMLAVAVIGLLANIATAFLLHRDAQNSLNLRSAFLHITVDAISSVAVIAGGVAILWTGAHWIDPLLTLLIAGYIISQSIGMLRETGHILMEGTPTQLRIPEVRDRMMRMDAVQDVHHLHLWSLDEHTVLLDAHVAVQPSDILQLEQIKSGLKDLLARELNIRHSTLEFELQGSRCPDEQPRAPG
ncbi:MAG: cation diffusion facilitator family transporter [Kiritimatiellae bacterium]|jgi:cobalt-zinc-cadmium efflux system protein|nr:cation diffusion facilitator family transporter [Kiritimatiellia bacterium]MDD4341240.1 cation diffusion facilitator family transporter [Kiritimatiellia bacterium]MDY0149470.1 cation diffusion facilitator family transporter [Kiritimatiellia bacterium]